MKELAAGESWRTLGLALLLGCFFLVAIWELYWPRPELENPVAQRWLGNLVLYGINGELPDDAGTPLSASECLCWRRIARSLI